MKTNEELYFKRLAIFLLILFSIGSIGFYFAEQHRKSVLLESTIVTGRIIWKGNKRHVNKLQVEYVFNGITYSKFVSNYFEMWYDIYIEPGDCIELRVANTHPGIIEINYEKGKIDC